MMENVFDFELLSLASKYEIEPLRKLCTDQLLGQIKEENVVYYWEEFLRIDQNHGRIGCENYVKQNWDTILRSHTYDELLSTDIEAAIKLALSTFENDNVPQHQHLESCNEQKL